MSKQKGADVTQNPRHPSGLTINPFSFLVKAGLFILSASSITFEINLTRLFSVAQFYHFAFMIVSTVLFGSAASGIALMVFPQLGRHHPEKFLSWSAISASLSTIGAYLLFNQLPFDSFSISWDMRQVGILVWHYLMLSLPFFFCGLVVSFLLNIFPERAGSVYGVNLAGSSLGCLLALTLPGLLGGDGMVLFCGGIAAIGAILFSYQKAENPQIGKTLHLFQIHDCLRLIIPGLIVLLSIMDMGFRLSGRMGFSWMALKISPYKSLSYLQQFPESRMIIEKWNSFSRLNVVESPMVRSLPGLSYRYPASPPAEDGLFIDGDDLSPVLVNPKDNGFSAYMPTAIVFQLRPRAKTLILEPRGGLDVIVALAQGACCVTAVEQNPLIVSAAKAVYNQPKVETIIDFERSYLKRSEATYDIILISLTNAYHPIQSGAYSLGEDYRYTVEALNDSIGHLNTDGILVFMRWLQDPPSEDLRAFTLAVEAVEQSGGNPKQQIVAFRGYNTTTVMIKREAFTASELATIRDFLDERAFDLSYAPDVRPQETNRFNIMPESIYYDVYTAMIDAVDRNSFYQQYAYNVSPPTDDHPFMGHYYKSSQARQIMAEWGKTWQPFGGAGYLVMIGLLILTIIVGSGLVLLPYVIEKIRFQSAHEFVSRQNKPNGYPVGYFACIGFAYLLVEIPLIQKFILFLGQPAYAFAIVLFSILFFSGGGSLLSHKIPLKYGLISLAALVLVFPALAPLVFEKALGFSMGWRVVIAILLVAPLGVLMGIPFPAGLRWIIQKGYHPQIPWFWGINGAASVVSAILAAMLALWLGFAWVLRIGAMTYFAAWMMFILDSRPVAKTNLPR